MTADESNAQQPALLIVDDEPIVQQSLADWFRSDGYDVDSAGSAKEALRKVAEGRYDIALVDIKMPGMDGLELQSRLAEVAPDLTVIMITAFASVDSAVKALKAGAYDYVTKPFDPDELSHLVRRAVEHRSLRSENIRLKESLEAIAGSPTIIGASPAMRRVLELVGAVSETDATVLIRGESGTGKELVARAIHNQSPRRYNPMVVVNCGALAEGVLESELFGHEKGAFTGAQYRHKGKFEMADGGTIFLDEIGAITQKVQVDLLRVLEDKVVTRVGGQTPISIDFRVIAATNQDLEAMVETGEFREDLFWRINVFTIEIPPLRERSGDIPLLAEHFLGQFCLSMNRRVSTIAPEAIEVLSAYSWPGNVRELENAIERAIVVGKECVVHSEDLPVRVSGGADREATGGSLADIERTHIQTTLANLDWNISKAAEALGVDRGTLYNKIKKYGLQRPPDGVG
jgi:DNA-binding NtrC family response regulator